MVYGNKLFPLSPEMSDSAFVADYSQPRNYGFNTAVGSDYSGSRNTIKACIHEDQSVMDGQPVRFRLQEPLQAGELVIPRHTLLNTSGNMVRERARNTYKYDPEVFSIPDIKPTSCDAVRDALRKERRVELAMENHRFYDLKRWGVEYAKSRMEKARKLSFPGDYANKLKAFPILQRDIDRSRGIVTQNPGW